MRGTRSPSDAARIDEVVAESLGPEYEPTVRTRPGGGLRRHWRAYLAACLVLTLVFALIAREVRIRNETPRYEALVVAIGADSMDTAAREVFQSETFALSIIDENGSALLPDLLTTGRLTLRVSSGSNTLSIEAVDADSEIAEGLADAAARAMALGLEQLDFFARPLAATPLRSSGQLTLRMLLSSLFAASVVVFGWSALRSRIGPDRSRRESDSAAVRDKDPTPYRKPTLEAPRSKSQSQLPEAPLLENAIATPETRHLSESVNERPTEPPPTSPTRPSDASGDNALTDHQMSLEPNGESSSFLAADRQPGDDKEASVPKTRLEKTGDLQTRLRIALLLERSFGNNQRRVRGPGPPAADESDSPNPESVLPTLNTKLNGIQVEAVLRELGPDGTNVELTAHISGIGPVYSSRLNGLGVTTCEQLANSDAESIAQSVGARTVNVEDWINQARAITASGDTSLSDDPAISETGSSPTQQP